VCHWSGSNQTFFVDDAEGPAFQAVVSEFFIDKFEVAEFSWPPLSSFDML
jgi:hypothetical protein